MMKNLKTFLIFFVILLVCSITPAIAVQTNTDPVSTENYAQLYERVHNIFSMISDAFDTEITVEQAQYLEIHSEQIESRGNASLNNLQVFFDYFSTISPDITTNSSNNTKSLRSNTKSLRSNTDKYTEDLNKMKEYLATRGATVETKNMNYRELGDYIGGNETLRNSIIVQIHDTDGYIRYLKITDFVYNDTDDHMELVSGEVKLPEDKDSFERKYVWRNDGSYSNPDRKFNIIITSTPGCRNYVLRNIWDKQYDDLVTKISHLDAFSITLTVTTSLGLGSLAVVGIYKLVDKMKDKEKSMNVAMNMANKASEGVPQEDTPLLGNLSEQRAAVMDAGQKSLVEILPQKRAYNSTYTIILSIIALGLVIGVGSMVGLVYVHERKSKYNSELVNNLNDYRPDVS